MTEIGACMPENCGRAESAVAGGCGTGGDLNTVAQCWHVPQDKGQEEDSMGNLS